MRIISGAWRGRKLEAPAGQATRPTSDRAREGLFSMLTSRIGTFEGLRVADLFAGSGALGLEALSRGAAHCLFLDSARDAATAIARNVKALGADERAEIRQQAAEYAMPPSLPCDIVFMDPPYESDLAARVLEIICTDGWLAPGALISVESGQSTLAVPPSLSVEAQRRFGKAHVFLLRAAA